MVSMRTFQNLYCKKLFACLVSLSLVSSVTAQLRVEIRRGVERPVPMAIVPFSWEGLGSVSPFNVSGLVTEDLGQSGRFAPMDVRDMVSLPSLPEDVRFQDWQIVEVDYLVILGRQDSLFGVLT